MSGNVIRLNGSTRGEVSDKEGLKEVKKSVSQESHSSPTRSELNGFLDSITASVSNLNTVSQ